MCAWDETERVLVDMVHAKRPGPKVQHIIRGFERNEIRCNENNFKSSSELVLVRRSIDECLY